MIIRPKRLRKNPQIRAMIAETHLRTTQLIQPLFISDIHDAPNEIKSMPGIFQWPLHAIAKELDLLSHLKIPAVLLFGLPSEKNPEGTASLEQEGVIQKAIRWIKANYPHFVVIADVCFCEYTDHGHCGILKNSMIDNDRTLQQLAKQAVSYADAGADWIAPSSMTDGMVQAIRQGLDTAGHEDIAILSYAVKYSSHFYGPFREAALGAPQFGDRKTYQMDFRNAEEALKEAQIDVLEGADLLMVKPAMNYLDIIYRIKQKHPEIPLCAYQVSGEYAMIKFAAQQGLLCEQEAMIESLTAIHRAGSDLIITYFAKEMAEYLLSNNKI